MATRDDVEYILEIFSNSLEERLKYFKELIQAASSTYRSAIDSLLEAQEADPIDEVRIEELSKATQEESANYSWLIGRRDEVEQVVKDIKSIHAALTES